jgi:hypothetical protein
MPRPRPTGSALRAPFDFVLGSQGAVRVLRVLSNTEVPLSQSELARRASLSLSGLPALLATLESASLVNWIGRGRTRQVQLHRSHPLAAPLRQLFVDEAARWRRIHDRLGEIVASVGESIIAAWIEGPVTVLRDSFDDPLTVGVLAEQPIPVRLQERLRQQTNQVQATDRLIIGLRFHQRADLVRFSSERRAMLEHATVLYGPAVADLLDQHDQRPQPRARGNTKKKGSRSGRAERPAPKVIATLIAERLVREPELIAAAQHHVNRRLAIASDVERLALLEWKGLLETLTARQVAGLLREDSERADRLRQNLPFVGALSDGERAQLFSSARGEAGSK